MNAEESHHFFEKYSPIVHEIAEAVAQESHLVQMGTVVEVDDLASEGFKSLLQAMRTVDPAHPGVRAYLYLRIRGAMIDFLRRQGRYRSRKSAYSPPLSLDRAMGMRKVPLGEEEPLLRDLLRAPTTLEEQVLDRERWTVVQQTIQTLSEREQQFLLWYLAGVLKKEIARRMGLSPIRITQIHFEIIHKIKKALE